WATEAAFRQEVMLAVPMILAALFVGRSAVEVGLLISVCALVLLAEIINSAIEAVVDRVGLDYHELSGKAKDLGSLAVLLSLTLAAVVWALIIIDRFIS
ncbi:MAG: diacylglycerol kinase, partial [Gammaproteobacteria bacterium]|nr:diacylglycerol kinase [Gammaproteobacteria bacterium]